MISITTARGRVSGPSASIGVFWLILGALQQCTYQPSGLLVMEYSLFYLLLTLFRKNKLWWRGVDSNHRPWAYETHALPLSYRTKKSHYDSTVSLTATRYHDIPERTVML